MEINKTRSEILGCIGELQDELYQFEQIFDKKNISCFDITEAEVFKLFVLYKIALLERKTSRVVRTDRPLKGRI